MIRLHAEFDTQKEAELWRDGMYRSYHPLGYSTHITIEQKTIERCSGCGSTMTLDDLRRWYPVSISCCPERNMVPETIWVAYGSRAESCD